MKIRVWSYLHYNQFSVGSASKKYPLTVGGFTGVGRDWFAVEPMNGRKFSTPDSDNDMKSGHCAAVWESGWWYTINQCYMIITSIDNHLNCIELYR